MLQQLPLTTKAAAASGSAFWQKSEEWGVKNEPGSLGVALWGRAALSSLEVKQANCPNWGRALGFGTIYQWLCCTGSGIGAPAVLQWNITSIVFVLADCGGVSLLLLMPEVLKGASNCLGERSFCICGIWVVVHGWFLTDTHLSSLDTALL